MSDILIQELKRISENEFRILVVYEKKEFHAVAKRRDFKSQFWNFDQLSSILHGEKMHQMSNRIIKIVCDEKEADKFYLKLVTCFRKNESCPEIKEVYKFHLTRWTLKKESLEKSLSLKRSNEPFARAPGFDDIGSEILNLRKMIETQNENHQKKIQSIEEQYKKEIDVLSAQNVELVNKIQSLEMRQNTFEESSMTKKDKDNLSFLLFKYQENKEFRLKTIKRLDDMDSAFESKKIYHDMAQSCFEKILQFEDSCSAQISRLESNMHNTISFIEENVSKKQRIILNMKKIFVHFYYHYKKSGTPREFKYENESSRQIRIYTHLQSDRHFYDFIKENVRFSKYICYFNNIMTLSGESMYVFDVKALPHSLEYMLDPINIFNQNRMNDIKHFITHKLNTLSDIEYMEFKILLTLYELNIEFELRGHILFPNYMCYSDASTSHIQHEFDLLTCCLRKKSMESSNLHWNHKIGFFNACLE